MNPSLCLSVVLAFLMLSPVMAEEKKPPVLNIGGIDKPGGTIKGVVKFDGKKVKPSKKRWIRMSADNYCAAKHPKPVRPETYVWGENDTLQNVFVYISKGLEGKNFDLPKKHAVIDQNGCMYSPHVSGVVVDQSIDIVNSDNTSHNVKMKSKKNGTFNQMMITGQVIPKTLSKPEMGVQFKCDVHPWMFANIHVMEHPFFAVTQADGTFTIKGLPPGDYELSVWHEFKKFKPVEKAVKVNIAEGETKQVSFTYKPPARKKK